MGERGMRVPEGIDAIADAVPTEFPEGVFTEPKRPSIRKIAVAKPPSLPRTPAAPQVEEIGDEAVLETSIVPPPPSSLGAMTTTVAIADDARPSAPEPAEPDLYVLPKRDLSRPAFVGLAALVAGAVVLLGFPPLLALRSTLGRAKPAVTSAAPATAPVAMAAQAPARQESDSPPEPPQAEPATAAPVPAVDVPTGMGRVTTEGAARGHRIFVDRHAVGQTPKSVLVRCGSHAIKIGSGGRASVVDVPCGGSVEVR